MRPLLVFVLVAPLLAPVASAQESDGPTEVEVGLLVINFGNYDTNKGFTPASFEFMNGRASAKDKIFDALEDGQRELWYRVQANLYSEPRFENYPYDTQVVEITPSRSTSGAPSSRSACRRSCFSRCCSCRRSRNP